MLFQEKQISNQILCESHKCLIYLHASFLLAGFLVSSVIVPFNSIVIITYRCNRDHILDYWVTGRYDSCIQVNTFCLLIPNMMMKISILNNFDVYKYKMSSTGACMCLISLLYSLVN